MQRRSVIPVLIPLCLMPVIGAGFQAAHLPIPSWIAIANLVLLIGIWVGLVVQKNLDHTTTKPSPAPYGAAIETDHARPSDASIPRAFPLDVGTVRWHEPAEPTALRALGLTLQIPGIATDTALVDVVAAWRAWIEAQADKREALLRTIGAMAYRHDYVITWRVAERFRRDAWTTFTERERVTMVQLWEDHGAGNRLIDDQPIAGTDPEKPDPLPPHAEGPGHAEGEEASWWRTQRIGADGPPAYTRLDPYGRCGTGDRRYVIQVWHPRARLADGTFVRAAYGHL